MKRIASGLLTACLIFSVGCNGKTQSSTEKKPTAATNAAPAIPLTQGIATGTKGNVLAEINGQQITDEEVMAKIKPRLARIENQIFDMKRDAVDQIVEEKILDAEAKKQNLAVADLLKKEVTDKVGEVTDKEAQDFYDQNKARFGTKTFDELKPQIIGQLKAKKAAVYRNNYMDRLMAKADINVYMEKPRVEVSAGNAPSKGPENALVTIVEYTDYECPFCAKVRPTIAEITNTYKNDVRYVVRNFPLDFHQQAKKAAVAGLCANDQKKFWDYNQKLWDNQRALDVDSLKKYAEEVKLDTKKFNECLDSDKFLSQVMSDQQEGAKIGVSGTPAFFINGMILTGAQPVEAFKKVIDQELRDAKRKKS
ncbi:MAG: thioredoxin domain-containing protein [Deltaproteobacteria bacterium]|nr:thioredoxin domain-containing protein [Deltaproteobacteria bacterium]